jgi:hypothetical protein
VELQTVVVRCEEDHELKAAGASCGLIISKFKDELEDGAVILCLSCDAQFHGVEDLGAFVFQPATNEDGHLGAVCKRCALAATDEELVKVFRSEWANC